MMKHIELSILKLNLFKIHLKLSYKTEGMRLLSKSLLQGHTPEAHPWILHLGSRCQISQTNLNLINSLESQYGSGGFLSCGGHIWHLFPAHGVQFHTFALRTYLTSTFTSLTLFFRSGNKWPILFSSHHPLRH